MAIGRTLCIVQEGSCDIRALTRPPGTSRDKSIVITPESSPPLGPGPYFIKIHQRTDTGRAQGKLTVDLTVAEAEIAAKVPHFGIPASLITTREGEVPPPQILEVRNAGEGLLNYKIATDQPWLSVSPDQGSAMEETDIIEIRTDPMAMEPGAFEGTITITEEKPGSSRRSSFAPTTAWPVKVPVTFIVIPESEESPPSGTTTAEDEEDSEDNEDDSEEDEEESGGPAVEARLSHPEGVDLDAAGNLFIADAGNRRVRKVDPSGTITTIAGDDSPAIEDRLVSPYDVAVDAAGGLYIADAFNHSIRRVDPSGTITTIAGTSEEGYAGDGGQAVEAQLAFPEGVAVDADGNLLIADYRNQRIRRVDTSGIISTFAGGEMLRGTVAQQSRPNWATPPAWPWTPLATSISPFSPIAPYAGWIHREPLLRSPESVGGVLRGQRPGNPGALKRPHRRGRGRRWQPLHRR